MAKQIALIGDKTTSGGIILDGDLTISCAGKGIALLGSKVTCPKCLAGSGVISEGVNNVLFGSKPVAYDGAIVACGCPIGSNKVITSNSGIFVDVEQTINSQDKKNNTSNFLFGLNKNKSVTNDSKITPEDFWKIYKEVADMFIRIPVEEIKISGSLTEPELPLYLKKSYLELLRIIHPDNFHNVTADMITFDLAKYLNDLVFSINECAKNIDFLLDVIPQSVRVIDGVNGIYRAIRFFVDEVSRGIPNSTGLKWCMKSARIGSVSDIASILNGI